MIFLSDVYGDHIETGPEKGTPVGMFIYVKDVDKAYKRAKAAGCTVIEEPKTMFWGDRTTRLQDPYGHSWTLATRAFLPDMEKMKEDSEKWWAEVKNKRKRTCATNLENDEKAKKQAKA
eukprot:CAMPEP_0184501778 /NCGR_PEP_ID=MMETSP0113_2-20130426/48521_1 /TAXON_ID=91329 /ORGANISM="Norrisiella sphaerica, Strain BC52" /LENGTH=118 /DNA_ID=CAMNT_0026890659 /DNA_START=155 /DNA_END=511 /DNA_ORIENTATION=-